MDELTTYVIDTSSLIDLHRWRPISKHRGTWKRINALIDREQLISPDEVFYEIRTGKDALAKWAAEHKKSKQLFVRLTKQHVGIAKQIIHRFPELVDVDRPTSQADPFVVALAEYRSHRTTYAERCVVVTNEKFTPLGRPRIPHVCASFLIPYMTIHQLFVTEGWEF